MFKKIFQTTVLATVLCCAGQQVQASDAAALKECKKMCDGDYNDRFKAAKEWSDGLCAKTPAANKPACQTAAAEFVNTVNDWKTKCYALCPWYQKMKF